LNRFVLITRHPADCGELQALLDPCDLTLRPYPVLRLQKVADHEGWREVMNRPSGDNHGSWLVMASPRAPAPFVAGCRERGAEHLLRLPVAVVGKATAHAAKTAGLTVEFVGPGTGRGLADDLLELLPDGNPVVFVCGHDHRPELPTTLGDAGHEVLRLVVYRMDPTPPMELPPLGPSLNAVILTSPRAAALYLEGVGGQPLPCPHWALGPTTRDAAAGLGIECQIPKETTLESLAEELCNN
jgi:uroporphyrinogen-III synthase